MPTYQVLSGPLRPHSNAGAALPPSPGSGRSEGALDQEAYLLPCAPQTVCSAVFFCKETGGRLLYSCRGHQEGTSQFPPEDSGLSEQVLDIHKGKDSAPRAFEGGVQAFAATDGQFF